MAEKFFSNPYSNVRPTCERCGGEFKRIHRNIGERFRYLAIYQCLPCGNVGCLPRPFLFHLGEHCRCPKCGTLRLTRLKERDRIDRMNGGFLNLLERIAGGRLYRCKYCRIQFYDRRQYRVDAPPPEAGASAMAAKAG